MNAPPAAATGLVGREIARQGPGPLHLLVRRPADASVSQAQGLSGHADRGELLAWLARLRRSPAQTYVVHGEPAAADALRFNIQNVLGWKVRVPQHGEELEA
jgi:predicted metal-dependent RNase